MSDEHRTREEIEAEGWAEEARIGPPSFGNPIPSSWIAREFFKGKGVSSGKFESQYIQEWKRSALDTSLMSMAVEYYERCEAYDRLHCSYRSKEGIALPMNTHEMALINRHASDLRVKMGREAQYMGASPEQWRDAMRSESRRRYRK